MQKINNITEKKLSIDKKDDYLNDLVKGFSKEKYNIKKTNDERRTFKKQLIAFIIVSIIAILTIVGASFTIYYAYKHNFGNSQNQQTQTSNVLKLPKKDN